MALPYNPGSGGAGGGGRKLETKACGGSEAAAPVPRLLLGLPGPAPPSLRATAFSFLGLYFLTPHNLRRLRKARVLLFLSALICQW